MFWKKSCRRCALLSIGSENLVPCVVPEPLLLELVATATTHFSMLLLPSLFV